MIEISVPCSYCERELTAEGPTQATADHLRPAWAGGRFKINACWRCNHEKAGLFLSDWLAILVKRKDPRALIVAKIVEAHPELSRPNKPYPPTWGMPEPGTGEPKKIAPPILVGRDDAEGWIKCPHCWQFCPCEKTMSWHLKAKHFVAVAA